MSMQSTEFILVLLFINYCIIFHMNNRKPTFANSCISVVLLAYKGFKKNPQHNHALAGVAQWLEHWPAN